MRRRNASSTSSAGLMLVANTTSTMNGSSNFWPVLSVRKSTRLSSGTIQRFSRSRGRAALPAEVVDHQHAAVGHRLDRRRVEARSRVNRPARAPRASARRRPSPSAVGSAPSARRADRVREQAGGRRRSAQSRWWFTGSNSLMMLPSTSMACGTAISPFEQVPDRLRDDGLAVARGAVDEHRMCRPQSRDRPDRARDRSARDAKRRRARARG